MEKMARADLTEKLPFSNEVQSATQSAKKDDTLLMAMHPISHISDFHNTFLANEDIKINFRCSCMKLFINQ